jgi:hypothetical protein
MSREAESAALQLGHLCHFMLTEVDLALVSAVVAFRSIKALFCVYSSNLVTILHRPPQR